jgi:hypothetical protein
MQPRVIFSLVAAAIALCGCAAAPGEMQPDRLTRFFDELAYGNPVAPEGVTKGLVRWNQTSLVYAIEGDRSPADDQRIVLTMRRFQALTGIALTRSESVKSAQITIAFAKGPLPSVHDELAACYTHSIYNGNGLKLSQVFVGTERPGTLGACLDHELMHAFGFGHHSVVAPSVMSPFRSHDTLTPVDEAALRTLYDQRLQIGMTRDQSDRLVARIFTEHVVTAVATTPVNPSAMALEDLEWHTVGGGDTGLVFSPPGLSAGVGHYYWGVPSDGSMVAEVSIWAAPGVERPRATLRYVRLERRRSFARTLSPALAALIWRNVADHQPKLGPTQTRQNALGVATYAIADTTEGPCIVFSEDRRDDTVLQLYSRIDGYYCAPKGAVIDAAVVLDGFTLRAPHYEPPGFISER